MFDQTFVDGTTKTKKPYTIFLSMVFEIALIGVMTRPEGDLSPYPLMFKGATLRGIFVGAREHFEGLMRAVAVNELKPVIDRTFAFDQAVEAFQYLKSAQHFGKVVITI